jgi:hypothetical protein
MLQYVDRPLLWNGTCRITFIQERMDYDFYNVFIFTFMS